MNFMISSYITLLNMVLLKKELNFLLRKHLKMIILRKKLINGLINSFTDSSLNNLKEVLYLMDLKLVLFLLALVGTGE